MACWILKTEPSTYSFADLVAEKTTLWDGVANPVALRHIRSMKEGDEVAIYHTGDEKAVVGLATVIAEPSGDPPTVELRAGRKLPRVVTLKEVKGDPAFAASPLARQPRLSVIPATDAEWRRLMSLGGL